MSKMRENSGPPVVLVVEDDDVTRAFYESTLLAAGYIVESAQGGVEAVVIARRTRPAVIVLDLVMPQPDGWEAAQTLKSAPATSGAWLIAVTGRSTREDIDRAYTAGCDVVRVKPLPPEELLRLVAEGLSHRPDGDLP